MQSETVGGKQSMATIIIEQSLWQCLVQVFWKLYARSDQLVFRLGVFPNLFPFIMKCMVCAPSWPYLDLFYGGKTKNVVWCCKYKYGLYWGKYPINETCILTLCLLQNSWSPTMSSSIFKVLQGQSNVTFPTLTSWWHMCPTSWLIQEGRLLFTGFPSI